MNILKEIMAHEVFPALGCTEPIAVAYAAAVAANEIQTEIDTIDITVDPGVFKNGLAVMVPNTNGERGNLIAGVLGALIKKPESRMEILKDTDPETIRKAREIIQEKRAEISCDHLKTHLYIEVQVKSKTESARAVVAHNHTNVIHLEINGQLRIREKAGQAASPELGYKSALKKMTIEDLVDLSTGIDQSDYDYLKRGIEMNLKASEAGKKLKKVGYYLIDLMKKGYLVEDAFSSSKIMTAAATDARMAGLGLPVMSSGGSGNQGIVAILVPYNMGKWFEIDETTVIQSIALSHCINSYVKCFTGELSPLCGCAIAAGVGAAAAIVFQQKGKDIEKITLAINNLISDIGGMLCDGAKGGCALKVVSSTDAAIRSAYMALNDHGITALEGFVGKTGDATIRNLSRISEVGMAKVDDTMLAIMSEKEL